MYLSAHKDIKCTQKSDAFFFQIGQTALHRACYQGHRECARVLIDHGGYLSAETKNGVTVIDVVFAHMPGPISFLTDIMDTRVRFIDHQNIGEDAQVISYFFLFFLFVIFLLKD